VENIKAMIFTPDILHLGMEFWKTLLQVCVCVISDSYFSSIKRFLLNFMILFLYFGVFFYKLLFYMDSRSELIKLKTFRTDANSFRKYQLLAVIRPDIPVSFSGLFPEVLQLEKSKRLVRY